MKIEKKSAHVKTIPESLKKKQLRDKNAAEKLVADRLAQKNKMELNKKYYLEQGKKHWESFSNELATTINLKREAKLAGSIYVPNAPKFFLVIRTKGINEIAPKEKKILQLFRLRQIHNAVFLRNTKATMNMLRRIEPWVTYGYPSHSTIKSLIYKRGFAKLNKQRIPLTSNLIIEEGLKETGIKCVEDLINEIWTCGKHFKEANNFIWPFKLNPPRRGLGDKRKAYLDNGSFGPRDEFINEFARRMI